MGLGSVSTTGLSICLVEILGTALLRGMMPDDCPHMGSTDSPTTKARRSIFFITTRFYKSILAKSIA